MYVDFYGIVNSYKDELAKEKNPHSWSTISWGVFFALRPANIFFSNAMSRIRFGLMNVVGGSTHLRQFILNLAISNLIAFSHILEGKKGNTRQIAFG